MVQVNLLLELGVLGIMYGLLYGLMSEGLTIVFGVMKVVNVAHGDFVVIGSYASYWAFVLAGINPILSVLLTIPLGFVLGAAVYIALVKRVIDSPELMSLLLTFGISTLIGGLLLYMYTPTQRAVPVYFGNISIGSLSIPENVTIAAAYAVIATIVLRLFLNRTFIGRAIRAVINNREAAMLVGVNPDRVSLITFGIGIAIACSVGSIIMLLQSISPTIGPDLTLIAFVVVVLGGLGNVTGALIGGVILGFVESIAGAFVNAAFTPAIGFLILAIVLVLRPQGILAR